MALVGKGEMPAIFARQMPKGLPALSIETIRGRARPPGKRRVQNPGRLPEVVGCSKQRGEGREPMHGP